MPSWIDYRVERQSDKPPDKTSQKTPKTHPNSGIGITLEEVQEKISERQRRLIEFDKKNKL